MNDLFRINKNRFSSARLASLFFIGFMITGLSVNVTQTDAGLQNPDVGKISTSYFELSGGFYCSTDTCFTDLDTTISGAGGSLLGAGTINDPYIIENLNITGHAGMAFVGITKYVIIRNNHIDSASSIGITLNNIANTIVVENNNISSGSGAVVANGINSSVVIKDNYFHDNGGWTVNLGESNLNLGYGIMNSSIVYNNTFVNNNRGIGSYYTNESRIYNNTIVNNQIEAMLASSNDELYIYNNTISNSGFGLKFWESNNYTRVENNTISDITEDSSFALGFTYWTVGVNSPKIIRNNIITNSAGVGIGSSNNATISNNIIRNVNGSGITTGHNATIEGNTIENFGLGQFQRDAITTGQNSSVSNNIITTGSGGGIFVEQNSEVLNNQISHSLGVGIRIQTINIKVIGNTITNSSQNGIDLTTNSDGDTQEIVSSNTIVDSKQNGISVKWSKGTKVESNTITNSGGSGIYLEGSEGTLVKSNTISGSKLFSVSLLSSPAKIESNTFENEVGINYNVFHTQTREVFWANEFISNTVHGLPLGYYENVTTDISTQHGQLFIINADNIKVTNNDFSNQRIPITIAFSVGVTLQSLTLTNNSYYSVFSYGIASTVDIVDSTIEKTHGTAVSSEGAINLRNTKVIDNHGDGLYVSLNSIIQNSEISRNEGIGVKISYRSNGIQVHDNLFDSNVGYAVAVETSPNFPTSQNAKIHHNNFINNAGGGVQALDNGSNNQWYDFNTMEGNYWDDWSGSGSYVLDGTATNEDPYPLGAQITFPRTITTTSSSSGPTDPTDTGPTDTQPTNTFQEEDDSSGGFLPSPPVNLFVIVMMACTVSLIRRKKNKL